MICELLFPSSILAVKLNRKTLVIVLEVEIYIYDISNMKLLHTIETSPNPQGEFTYVGHETSRQCEDRLLPTFARNFSQLFALSPPHPIRATLHTPLRSLPQILRSRKDPHNLRPEMC